MTRKLNGMADVPQHRLKFLREGSTCSQRRVVRIKPLLFTWLTGIADTGRIRRSQN